MATRERDHNRGQASPRRPRKPQNLGLALQAELADTLPRIFLLGFLVYATITVIQLNAPDPWSTPLSPLNVATTLLLLVFGLVIRRRPVPAPWAHQVFAVAALVILANCVLRIYWTATPTLSVVFFLIGVACLARSTTWFLFLEAAALVSLTVVVVLVLEPESWAGFLGLHAIGLANSILIYFVRARADRRALALRAQLEHQNELLESSAASAKEAERRYQATLDTASDVIFTMDPEGRPTYLNPVAKQIFPQASWGNGVFFLSRVHPQHRDAAARQIKQQLREGHSCLSQELRLVDEGGQERWLEQIVHLVKEEGQPVGLHVVARDLSQRKRAEQALVLREKFLAAVAEVANLMISKGEFLSALRAALPLLGKATRVSRVHAFKNSTDESGRIVTSQIAEWCDSGIAPSREIARLENLALADLGLEDAEVFVAGGLSCATTEIPDPVRRLAESLGVLSLAAVPIFVDARPWGFIGFDDCRERRRWGSGEMDTLRLAARIIGGALARRATERELRQARDAAEAATRTKSEFLANMSHEIRTPLNGILGMTDLVMQGPLDAAQREQMSSILSSGKSLLTIINDILDLSRIEAGRIDLDSVPFRFKEVVWDVVQLLRPSAREKDLRFEVQVDDSIEGLIVVGDPVRLRQILTNILGNAIKFTDRGFVTVEAAGEVSPGTATVRLTVADSGIGIEKRKQQQLFEPFEQGDSSVTRRFGGTGLGLSITRSLVSRMSGTISLKSEVGRGTEVCLSIPFAVASLRERRELAGEERAGTPQTPAEATGDAALRALLAEDDKLSQTIASAFLAASGCSVDLADNGLEAVKLAAQSTYDIIFLDVQMPELDGLSATRAIRAGPLNHHTPIVAMTALAMDGDRERCLAAGMNHYLSKPLERGKVVQVLEWCRRGALDVHPPLQAPSGA